MLWVLTCYIYSAGLDVSGFYAVGEMAVAYKLLDVLLGDDVGAAGDAEDKLLEAGESASAVGLAASVGKTEVEDACAGIVAEEFKHKSNEF